MLSYYPVKKAPMKLEKITLHNFRCFGNEETAIGFDNITTLIGNNSSGKTAVLAALNCLLNNRSVIRSDFHVPNGKTLEELKRAHDHLFKNVLGHHAPKRKRAASCRNPVGKILLSDFPPSTPRCGRQE